MVSKSDCKSLLKTPDSIYSKEATKTIANKLSPVTKKTVNSKSAVTAPVKALSAASKIVRSQDSIFLNDLYLIDTSGKREYKYGVSSGPGDNRDGSGTYTYEALDNSKDPVYKISSVLGDSYTDMYFGDFLYKTYNFKYQGKLDGSGVGSVDVDYCTYNDMYEYICGSYSEQAGLPPPNLETYGMLSLPNYTWRSNGHVDMEVTGAWKGTLSDTHESHVSLITTDTPQKVRQMDFELSNISAGMTAVSKNMEKREISCAELSVGGKPPQVDPNDNKFCIGKVKA